MAPVSHKVLERMLDLAWSLWTGLGVPGRIDNHADHAIDPESLIIFTAALCDADPRLRDEATDWCIRYGNLISGARLKNLLVAEDDRVRASYGELAATVAAHSSLRWPNRTTARDHTLRKRPGIQSFDRGSQVALRLRGLLGVSARAEIIRVLLAEPKTEFSAADLAAKTGYTKRNVAQVLDTLCLAAVLESFPVRNQIHFRIRRRRLEQFKEQLAPIPAKFVPWPSALHVLTTAFGRLANSEGDTELVRAVEAKAVVKRLEDGIRAAGIPEPDRNVKGPAFWKEFSDWLLIVADNLATG